MLLAISSEIFLEKFFPETAKIDMERKFVNLQQESRSVDDYVAEFTRLSRFALHFIADDRDRARRFEQGLSLEVQKQLSTSLFTTYAEILNAGRRHEQVSGRIRTMQAGASKCPVGQVPVRQVAPVQVKRKVVCNFYKNPGHTWGKCWKVNHFV